jgi:hypothetical protein
VTLRKELSALFGNPAHDVIDDMDGARIAGSPRDLTPRLQPE